MGTDPADSGGPARLKRGNLASAIVAAVGILAAITWRIVWPWTGTVADAIFLAVIVIGLTAAFALRKRP
jgi:hypothetical protein